MRKIFSIILITIIYSCERPIDFTPETQEPKLVVEGIIEGGQYPTVYLTRSLDFFSKISREELTGSFVRNAEVTISNATSTEILKEYQIRVSGDTLLYYYSIDTTNGRVGMLGELGASYQLNIKVDGKEYDANTTIPLPVKTLDSLYYRFADIENDTAKVLLYGRFNDPPGYGNYIRYFTNVNKQKSIAFILSEFIDMNYADALRVSAARHDVVGVKIFDKMDMQLPKMGMLRIEDAETGEQKWVDTSSSFVRHEYEKEFFAQTEYCQKVFKKSGCDLLHVRTDEDYVKVLQKFFISRNK